MFDVHPGFGWRTWIMSQLERRVNRSRGAQGFHEANLAQAIGCNEMRLYLARITSSP